MKCISIETSSTKITAKYSLIHGSYWMAFGVNDFL